MTDANQTARAGVPQSFVTTENTLPADWREGTFVGRVMRPGIGPAVVRLEKDGTLTDITQSFPTMSKLCAEEDPVAAAWAAKGENIGPLSDILAASPTDARKDKTHLLAPIDLQTIKAAGVTFAVSLVERMVEEACKGNPDDAPAIRKKINGLVGEDLSGIKPGSEKALQLLKYLTDPKPEGLGFSHHYPTVGLGRLAEIFTKADTMASVGHGADSGFLEGSNWNNPEPEVVVVTSPTGKMIGAALGDDINHRDIEGDSALLLGECKNQKGSCVVGPFIRLFDKSFNLDDVRKMDVELNIEGKDGFKLPPDKNSMSQISRDPADLVKQMYSEGKEYPDGAVLFCGTMFVPKEREAGGKFAHKPGDIVTIKADKLGSLTSQRVHCPEVSQPEPGLYDFMASLSQRGVLPKGHWMQRADRGSRVSTVETHLL